MKSNTSMRFGWLSLAPMRASFASMSMNSGSLASCGSSVLSTTFFANPPWPFAAASQTAHAATTERLDGSVLAGGVAVVHGLQHHLDALDIVTEATDAGDLLGLGLLAGHRLHAAGADAGLELAQRAADR